MKKEERGSQAEGEDMAEADLQPGREEMDGDDSDFGEIQRELDETKEQLLRTMADFQNYRRRHQEQAAQLRQFATENFVTQLLPVLDNFERTVNAGKEGASLDQILAGVHAVERQLRSVLEGQNVQRIEAVGQPFDPEIHEAIAMEPSPEHEANTVIVEVEPGYRMGGRVIRPSRVKVAADK